MIEIDTWTLVVDANTQTVLATRQTPDGSSQQSLIRDPLAAKIASVLADVYAHWTRQKIAGMDAGPTKQALSELLDAVLPEEKERQ